MSRLDNKVAIVTGGANGMGASHVRRFVAEGAAVIFTDINEKDGQALAEDLGERAKFVQQDVANQDDWIRVVAEAEKSFGPVDILVNNAGMTFSTPMEELTVEKYQSIINVNQLGPFLGMKTVAPSMKRVNGGSIVNIASIGSFVGTKGSFAYDATKFAVRGMTKTAALELAQFGIRVNSVHPGMISTQMLLGQIPPEIQDQLAQGIPAGRFADPSEVSNMVLYLASDESSYSSGAEFKVDGGYLA